jgi:hypothetical protein
MAGSPSPGAGHCTLGRALGGSSPGTPLPILSTAAVAEARHGCCCPWPRDWPPAAAQGLRRGTSRTAFVLPSTWEAREPRHPCAEGEVRPPLLLLAPRPPRFMTGPFNCVYRVRLGLFRLG